MQTNFYIYGGNEQSSYKYVSELLGKETIDTNTYGKSTGHSGNYSTNYQLAGRELMTQDEVRMLDNSKAILLIRGEKPIIDDKYDIMKHPNIKYTTDGGAKIYEHGTIEKAIANIQKVKKEEIVEYNELQEIKDTSFELLSEEDIENYYLMEEYENERKEKNKQTTNN